MPMCSHGTGVEGFIPPISIESSPLWNHSGYFWRLENRTRSASSKVNHASREQASMHYFHRLGIHEGLMSHESVWRRKKIFLA